MISLTHSRAVLAGLALGMASLVAQAAFTAEEMIRSIVSDLISELSERRLELESDEAALYAMVDELVVPHIALDKSSKLILGDHWKSASEMQRQDFTVGFKDLLIRSYATAMFNYTGQEELRYGPPKLKGRIAIVPTDLVIPGEAPVPVNYYCLRDKSNTWKIYDIQIYGISLIMSYRNQYDQYIDTHGLDALIKSLQSKTAEPKSKQ
jgi:phospholipid transport system substrate-binding protein